MDSQGSWTAVLCLLQGEGGHQSLALPAASRAQERNCVINHVHHALGLPRWLSDKKSTCQCRKPQKIPLGQEDPLEKEIATHSRILAWVIPWTEEPRELQSVGLQRVRHDLATKQQQEQIMTLNPGSRQVGTTRKTHSK